MSELDRFRQEWRSEVEHRLHNEEEGASVNAGSSTSNAAPPSSSAASSAIVREKNNAPGPSSSRSISPTRLVTADSTFRAERPEHVFHNTNLSRKDLDALEAFEKAVDSEHTGKLSDAVRHYRDAFRLNEKVDKLYREKYYSIKPQTNRKNKSDGKNKSSVSKSSSIPKDVIKALGDLTLAPEDEELPCPILRVPVEILAEILQYLALDDLSSFTKCTYVCKKFAYLGYTTRSIWMALCKQAYSRQHYTEEAVEELCDGDDSLAVKKYWGGSWRKMYLERPRIRFDGVYISTCNYLRPGVGQTWNAPIHMVTYYRYCKFYEDGTCMNLLTTDEPSDVVPVFTRQITGGQHDVKHNTGTGGGSSRQSRQQQPVVYTKEDGTVLNRPKGIMNGTWKINSLDGKILIESEGSVDKYMFYMSLQICSSGHNRHNKLKWVKFWSINKLTQAYGEFTLRHDKSYFFLKRNKIGIRSVSAADQEANIRV